MRVFLNLALVAAVLGGSNLALAEDQTPEIYSFRTRVTCETADLRWVMQPRNPLPGEQALSFERVGPRLVHGKFEPSIQRFIRGKVDVTVTRLADGETTSFVANDYTDPWESDWPVFVSEGFAFLAESAGRPMRLEYGGRELSRGAECSF